MGMCNYFLMLLPKFKMAARGQPQIFKVRNYLNFTITFPMIRRCAGVFLKVLLKFKMAATDQLQFFCGRKNLKKLKAGFIQFLQSHPPCYGDVQVIFFKVLLKFKMAAVDEIHNLLWSQKLKN